MYGCKNLFLYIELRQGESVDTGLKKKAEMQRMWMNGQCERSVVEILMAATHHSQ